MAGNEYISKVDAWLIIVCIAGAGPENRRSIDDSPPHQFGIFI